MYSRKVLNSMKKTLMAKLPTSVSEADFNEYFLPHLTHIFNRNRQKVSCHYIFNAIIYVLKSGCAWRTLKPDDGLVTWQNIYYHFRKWSQDGSFEKLFAASHSVMRENLALECLK